MYPIGEEIAKESTKFKSNWKFSSMSWDSNNEDNWPKLFHYRVSHMTEGHGVSFFLHSFLLESNLY